MMLRLCRIFQGEPASTSSEIADPWFGRIFFDEPVSTSSENADPWFGRIFFDEPVSTSSENALAPGGGVRRASGSSNGFAVALLRFAPFSCRIAAPRVKYNSIELGLWLVAAIATSQRTKALFRPLMKERQEYSDTRGRNEVKSLIPPELLSTC